MIRTLNFVGIVAMVLMTGRAGAVTFVYTGAVQDYTIADAGVYTVQASGAQGGGPAQKYSTIDGNVGAGVAASFAFAAGTKVHVVVGGHGLGGGDQYHSGSGGGGGTFVMTNAYAPLVVAGGGGGAGVGSAYSDGDYSYSWNYGTNAVTTGDGSSDNYTASGGKNGNYILDVENI